MEKMFDQRDIDQIMAHGLTVEEVGRQMGNFKKGFAYLPVKKAATVGDGIVSADDSEAKHYADLYDSAAKDIEVVKFVPASGAATRMFKSLFEFVKEGKSSAGVQKVLDNVGKFAFYELIKDKVSETDPKATIQAILDYGANLPKGLILFHSYPDGPRTALEEQLAEGAMYAAPGGKANIHLTISAEHKKGFEELIAQAVGPYEKKFGVKYDISTSQQQASTDTIAVTLDNQPFREADGSLVFRPAGHGALIENLNHLDADIAFIKNIDNVTIDSLKADTVFYKKVLAGILLDVQSKAFEYLRRMDANEQNGIISEIETFVESQLQYKLPESYFGLDEPVKAAMLRSILDRPVRVCGMVRNEGEPGGGPFWVENPDGSLSLQIGESAQIDPAQMDMMRNGTHFNPVDLVCGIKSYKGEKFDLNEFVDPETGFISEKSKDGRPLKAQERPGLWNGAMANWSTIFADVPVSTFSPVKELADLLRPTHLG